MLIKTSLGARRSPTTACVLVGLSLMVLCVSGCGQTPAEGPGPLPGPTAPSGVPTEPAPPATMTVLQGFVIDGLRRLSGVSVAVMDGALAGATTITDAEGRFAFANPVSLPVRIQLRRDGYAETIASFPNQRPDNFFTMEPLALFDFQPGNYVLRVSLDAGTARSWPNLPQAPCAGIPGDALEYRLDATVTGSGANRSVRITGEGLTFPSAAWVVLGGQEAAVVWDTIVPVDKNLGNSRYVQWQGPDYSVPGPISSSASAISISNPIDLQYCRLTGSLRPANVCSQVPSSQIVEFHACSWDRAVLQFERE